MTQLKLALVQVATDQGTDGGAGKETELRQFLPDLDCFVIGRGPTADVTPSLGGRMISMNHATVVKRPDGGWTVYDGLVNSDGDRLGPPSTNGLFSNGVSSNGNAVLLSKVGDTVSLTAPQIGGLAVAVVAVDSLVKAAMIRVSNTELKHSKLAPYETTQTPAQYAPHEQRSDINEIKAELSAIGAKVEALTTALATVEAVNNKQDMGIKLVRRVSVTLGCLLVISLIAAVMDADKRERYIDTAIGLALSGTLAGAGLVAVDGGLSPKTRPNTD